MVYYPKSINDILEILGREPNLTELGIFSVMVRALCLQEYEKTAWAFPNGEDRQRCHWPSLGKSGEENAGVIDVGDGWGVAFKIESHNHPSAIEPFEGAATGWEVLSAIFLRWVPVPFY